MDKELAHMVGKGPARRRLIRGSFSLPAVLAVHNGSALAARSNQFRCVLNQTPSSGGVAPGLTDTSLNWMRVVRYRKGNTNPKYYVSVQDLIKVGSDVGLSYGGPSGTSVEVSISGSLVTASWLPWHSNASLPAAPSTGNPLVADGSVAVLFQSSSVGTPPVVTVKVVGFVKEGAAANAGPYTGASTQSCWASIL